ncbi:uncharacterized protein [Eurosta solidaginis]|uniref:uncharacterized protein n=1 Tax=Eurosta solidaginis TaxID=178769 RepID=UPI003531174A
MFTAPTTTIYKHEQNNVNNEKANGNGEYEEGSHVELDAGGERIDAGGECVGIMDSNELYRYASVASLGGAGCGGGVGATGGTTVLPIENYTSNAGTGSTSLPTHTPHTQASTTILKTNSNGSGRSSIKGSYMNSPHMQQLGVPQRDNFCGCFSCCESSGGAGAQSLTFWPALFANLGICTLLLGYLFIGSFLFLTIETSSDGGSAAGVVSDPHALPYAQNAYISTQQQQQQHKNQPHKLTPQPSFTSVHPSKLYKSNEPLLEETNTGGVHQLQVAQATDEAKLKPHARNSDFHVNTPQIKWQADERILKFNSTGKVAEGRAAPADITVAKQFGLMSKPETETYIDNRHASKLWSSNIETHSQQAAMEAQAFGGAAFGTIGNDINVADINANTETGDGIAMGVGDEDDDNSAALAAGAWGGENVALQRTVENIWDITVSLNILYKENWTKLAALEINKFQDQLVKRLAMDLTLSTAGTGAVAAAPAITNNANLRLQQQQGLSQQPPSQSYDYHSMKSAKSKHYGNDAANAQQQQQRERYWQLQAERQPQWQLQKQQQQFEWNFATSFLYSLTVVTTVGYGTITPRTTLGRMVTIVYATFGIPLTLVYLSSIGSILAKLASGFCEHLLCCCSRRSTMNKRHAICGFKRQQVSDKKCNFKLQQLQSQQHHQQLQSAQQHQQRTTKPVHSAHLPYCCVRPPADAVLSYGEHSAPPLSSHSSGTRANSIPALRWSLALPLAFCVMLLLAYISFGSLVIVLLEQWSLFDGIYFCFMNLTTIGFCDLLPGAHAHQPTTATSSSSSTLVVWFCSAYILSGLTLTSMCVNMLHDEFLQHMRVVVKFKQMTTEKSAVKERSCYGAPP